MSIDPLFGLSALPPRVALAVASTYGHHRTPWFEQVLDTLTEQLRPAFSGRFTPLFLTGTGLSGREAVVANLVRPSDRVLATSGDFESLARAWGADVRTLTATGAGVDPTPDIVLLEHVSQSGSLVDVASVRAMYPKAIVGLDASVSFGADVADMQGLDVDAVVVVPERALMGIPGVTVIAVADAFIRAMTDRRSTLVEEPFLLDLVRYHRAATKAKHTTPYSPNISACVALQAALEHIHAEGGLGRHQQAHAERAAGIRDLLRGHGIDPLEIAAQTNAFTSCVFPDTGSSMDVVTDLRAAGIDARRFGSAAAGVQIAHAGYMREAVLEAFSGVVARIAAKPTTSLAVAGVRETPIQRIEPPFTIESSELVAQAVRHASRASSDEQVRGKVEDSAKRLFRYPHVVDESALRHRTVGFVGAGRIVSRAVELCRARGIDRVMVYSPSLASASAGKEGTPESRRLAAWATRGVTVAASLEELFEQSHAVVLLPVVYDETAVKLFGKAAAYGNHGLVSADLLARAERAGRLDLLINAAARGALVDRPAVARALADGWLRYYSDEMPSAGDPLLAYENARFSAHVGGSCRAPQAVVARNTHEILRAVIRQLLTGQPIAEASVAGDYALNIVNAHLLGETAERREKTTARDVRATGRVRILLTDPFDLEALAFERLEWPDARLDVHDLSAQSLSPDQLIDTLGAVQPHIVMLRSRTTVDDAVAQAMVEVPGLVLVIRPGVGVDNLHGGFERLSAAGVPIINEPYGNSGAVAEMALHFILSGTGSTLLAPGPTNFNPDVFDVTVAYDEVRLSQPVELGSRVGRRIGRWLGAHADALAFSGPGTALMEASIANLTPPDARGLVLSNGKFGDRFVEIARARRRPCEVLQVPEKHWGAAVQPRDVERLLQTDTWDDENPPLSFICFQQNETSSGITYPQESIRELVRIARTYNPEMVLIADAISGALAHRLEFDALDLDVMFFGSQKALGVSAGLAFAVLSDRALGRLMARAGYAGRFDAFCLDPMRDRYLDELDSRQQVHSTNLLRAAVAARRHSAVDTPSLFHLLSTDRALDLFDREGGPEIVAARHAAMAHMVRNGVRQLGLELMPRQPFESDSVTVALLPAGIDASAIRKSIAQNTGIAVAGAQGDYWKARMIRIGTLGFVTRADVARFLRALRVALSESERDMADGKREKAEA